MKGPVCLLEMPTFKPGDQPPEGYLEWHEWATVQHRAGLRQRKCGHCGKWKYPQELSDKTVSTPAKTSRGTATSIVEPLCIGCVTREPFLTAKDPTR